MKVKDEEKNIKKVETQNKIVKTKHENTDNLAESKEEIKKDGNCSAVCIIPQRSADWEEWAVMDDESSSGRFPTLLFPHRLACTN